MARNYCMRAVLLYGLVTTAAPALHAQDAVETSLAETRRVMQALEALLEQTDRALQQERQAHLAAQTERAKALLDEQAKVQVLEAKVQSARSLRTKLEAALILQAEAEQEVVHSRQQLDERLQLLAAEVPGTEPALPTEPQAHGAALSSLIAAGRQVQVRQVQLHVVDGSLQTVKLLTVGRVHAAYKRGEGTVGVMVPAPTTASGYRWSEQVDPALAKAYLDCMSDGAHATAVPMELTRTLDVAQLPQSVGMLAAIQNRLVKGGLVMLPLVSVLLLGLVMVAERTWVLWGRNGIASHRLAEGILAVASSDLIKARELAQSDRGAVASVLATSLQPEHQEDAQAVEDAIQAQLLQVSPWLHHRLGLLAVLAATAPLLGLLGTVTGIIRTFAVVERVGAGDPRMMAGGISEALITTATGLVIAIPLLLATGFLRGRADHVLADCERFASRMLLLRQTQINQGQDSDQGPEAGE